MPVLLLNKQPPSFLSLDLHTYTFNQHTHTPQKAHKSRRLRALVKHGHVSAAAREGRASSSSG